MPKIKNGFVIDDTPLLTNKQFEELRKLIEDGKQEEADKFLNRIIEDKEKAAKK